MTDCSGRIVVTGLGVVSAAGSSVHALLATLRKGRPCLQPIAAFDTAGMTMSHAGETPSFDPSETLSPVRVRTLDRGSQMAVVAAGQAITQASGIVPLDLARTGVAIGVSGAIQYQNTPLVADRSYPVNRRSALYFARSTPAFQADIVAGSFGLGGPRVAFASASLSSALAVAHAMDLLRGGHATAMLVGGGEIQTLFNALGMDAIGVGARGMCAPFYASDGMSFGDGAAFLLLETLTDASTRHVELLAELVSSGFSADAYHDISNDPSGRGLVRAIGKALGNANASPSEIGWIRASGTGHKSQDIAERLALEQSFGAALPPVTSTDPYFGHVNGVSPLLGLVAGITAQEAGIALAFPSEDEARARSPLPLMAPGPMPSGDWLLNAVAFGGTNGALIAGVVKERRPLPRSTAAISIAGAGMVSSLGVGCDDFLVALRQNAFDPLPIRTVNDDLIPRVPGVQTQRRERVVHWSLSAMAQALSQSNVPARGLARIGLLLGLSRNLLTPFARLAGSIGAGDFNASTGRSLLKTSRFSMASELAHAFGLQGYCGTMALGVNGGVQLLAHGAELLRSTLDLDGLLVIAADEWAPLCDGFYRALGLLGPSMHPYDPNSRGIHGGEGAAALFLARDNTLTANAWATIVSTSFGGTPHARQDTSGEAYGAVLQQAAHRAGVAPGAIDFVLGQGCGVPLYDQCELSALARLREHLPLSGVAGHTGLVESAGGLFSVIAAAAALRDGCLAQLAHGYVPQGPADFIVGTPRLGTFRHALVCGSSERGAHAAIVLKRREEG